MPPSSASGTPAPPVAASAPQTVTVTLTKGSPKCFLRDGTAREKRHGLTIMHECPMDAASTTSTCTPLCIVAAVFGSLLGVLSIPKLTLTLNPKQRPFLSSKR